MRAIPLALVIVLLAAPAAPAAELRFAGDAAMGLTFDSNPRLGEANRRNASRLQLYRDIRLRAEFRGQTDGGLSYGIMLDLDDIPRSQLGRHRD